MKITNNKYLYLLVIQQYFDPFYGWEDVDQYDKTLEYNDWKYDLREYRLMGYPTRTINRREINPQWQARQLV